MDIVVDFIQTLAAIATAVGVLIAGRQLNLTKQQSVTAFEDQLSEQYRAIARCLPVKALLGESLSQEEHTKALSDFYHYFDLSNEQAYLHSQGRIRPGTWKEWREGIEQNLERPAFEHAWREISTRAPKSFNDLREHVPAAAMLASGREQVTRAPHVTGEADPR